MILTKLYSELQVNPRSIEVYRRIMEHYQKMGMLNEANAFKELITRKFHVNGSSNYKKQSEDNRINP